MLVLVNEDIVAYLCSTDFRGIWTLSACSPQGSFITEGSHQCLQCQSDTGLRGTMTCLREPRQACEKETPAQNHSSSSEKLDRNQDDLAFEDPLVRVHIPEAIAVQRLYKDSALWPSSLLA